MKVIRTITALLLAAMVATACNAPAPAPYGAVPTPAQVEWQRMEVNMFCHFGPNTFTGAEWGTGGESANQFCPTAIDCAQWVQVAQLAGMHGIIITAKHHDGFCLWPSRQSNHTVAQSRWQGGQGDVLRLLRQAVDAHNAALADGGHRVEMGVYTSPWDRNHPTYGTEQYNQVFAATLREVHEGYGPLFEQWFDGACGEGPNGRRQQYDWPLFKATVQEHNPQCVMFSDVGPGCRWVGNESGYAAECNYSTIDIDADARTTPRADCGTRGGARWIPAEADVSIRNGWFWHPAEEPRSVRELVDIYFGSVGRNALLLLNVPPDTSGRICAADSARLVQWRLALDSLFAHDLTQHSKITGRSLRGRAYAARNVADTAYHTYWAAEADTATLRIALPEADTISIIALQEYIPLGQRVAEVRMRYRSAGGQWHTYGTGSGVLCTTVGYKRLVRLEKPLCASAIELHFVADAPVVINRIALYKP